MSRHCSSPAGAGVCPCTRTRQQLLLAPVGVLLAADSNCTGCAHSFDAHYDEHTPGASTSASSSSSSTLGMSNHLPPFRYLCTPTGSPSKKSLPGEPATLAYWREQLLMHQPHVGEGTDDRVLYAWERNETLETDEQVAGFVAFYQSHPALIHPEVNLLTRADIRKRQSPTLKASSHSSSKGNSPPRERLPASGYSSSQSLNSHPGPPSDASGSSGAPSSTPTVSTLDWSDPSTTLAVWLQRQQTLQERREFVRQVLLVEHLIPDLANIAARFALEPNRYDGRRVQDVQRLLEFLQGQRGECGFFIEQ